MKYLILAGGYATRLWPLSEHRAKPLLLVNGKTILAHILEQIPRGEEVILLTNKRFEASFVQEIESLNRQDSTKIFLEDSYNDGEKLGALGAVAAAIEEYNIDDNVVVMAGDNILPELRVEDLVCGEDESVIAVREVEELWMARRFGVVEAGEKMSEELRAKREERRTIELVSLGKGEAISISEKKEAEGLSNKTPFGFPLVKGDKQQKLPVLNFEEKPDKPKSKLVSTGFMSFGRKLLPLILDYAQESPDALGGIFPYLLASNFQLPNSIVISAVLVPGDWFDVGSFETYLDAHRVLQKQANLVGNNVHQSENVLSGKVFIGQDSVIKNSTLHDVIIYPGCRIENCHISHSVIDTGCRLAGLDLNQKLVRGGTEFGG